jgi:hypothetical protein
MLCRQLVSRFRGTSDPVIADTVAKSCLIVNDSGVDLNLVTEFAETALRVGREHKMFRALPWFEFCRGLAAYRLGDAAGAEDWMLQRLRQREMYLERDIETYAVLAMAQYRLNRPDEARATLSKGIELAAKEPGESDYFSGNWQDALIGKLLMQEAKALIEAQE